MFVRAYVRMYTRLTVGGAWWCVCFWACSGVCAHICVSDCASMYMCTGVYASVSTFPCTLSKCECLQKDSAVCMSMCVTGGVFPSQVMVRSLKTGLCPSLPGILTVPGTVPGMQ